MTSDQNTNDRAADSAERPRFRPVPWTPLETPQDVELWIDEHNRSMQELVRPQETGVGVRFRLAPGGDVYMQTTADAVILDVEPDAGWIAPLIMAATGAEQPSGTIWVLPDDKLVQLLLGLSTLVEHSLIVTGHNFGKHARRHF
ncbi:hypothetical protein [Massilia luteola]|uniref:hypothetical protein n=1 Tax=Massilia luteola TaxID=3081751 RepID=UPI002ACBFA1B|nr:hypothetical protein [Massilia sp. Gc5]